MDGHEQALPAKMVRSGAAAKRVPAAAVSRSAGRLVGRAILRGHRAGRMRPCRDLRSAPPLLSRGGGFSHNFKEWENTTPVPIHTGG